MIDKFLLYSGQDVFFPNGEFYIHQPTMSEWARFGEDNYYLVTKILSSQVTQLIEDKNVPDDVTKFDIIMAQLEADEHSRFSLMFKMFLMMTIVDSSGFIFYPDRIIFKLKSTQDFKIIDKELFEPLVVFWCEILDASEGANSNDFNPSDTRAQEIAAKLRRGRERVQKEKGGSNITSIFMYTSLILSTNGYTQQEINEMTIVQFNSIVNIYKRKELYDSWFLGGIFGGHGDSEPMQHWLEPEKKE